MNGELAQVQSGGLYLKSSILRSRNTVYDVTETESNSLINYKLCLWLYTKLSDTYQAVTQWQNDVGYNDKASKDCGVENEAIHTSIFLIKDHGKL